jgi:uncharacterized protein YunC (DUF1805 family)
VKLIGRLLILPFKLLLATFETAFRAGRLVGSVPVKVGRRTTRIMGIRGVIGLSDADLTERVVFELEHAPRTWHLSQPTVTVVSGRAILSGSVAQSAERDELGRVAAAVPGVVAVDNLIEVDEPESAPA